jgi:transcriptional regulator with GAF, ATPase, and Fis domain
MNNHNKEFLEIYDAYMKAKKNKKEDAAIHQVIVEKFSEVKKWKRCMMWRIYFNKENVEMGKITAGVPKHGDEHGIGLDEPLDEHKDLVEVKRIKNVLHIKDPLNSIFTDYGQYRKIIKRKEITETLHIPLFYQKGETLVGIIVIDAVKGQRFNKDDIEFCGYVGDLLSLIIDLKEGFDQKVRDEIYNPVVYLDQSVKKIVNSSIESIALIQKIIAETENSDVEIPDSTKELLEKLKNENLNTIQYANMTRNDSDNIKKKIPEGRKDF